MLRNRAVALILGIIVSPIAVALGLGPIQSSSFLNEPFSGRIELLGAKAGDFDTLKVELAPLEQFERAGLQYTRALGELKFSIDSEGPGKDFVVITSKDPIREPFLNFLVEMNWSSGRLLREYTVLLDPPLYDKNRKKAPPAAAKPILQPAGPSATMVSEAAITPPAASSSPTVYSSQYSAGDQIGPVVASDTLWSLASAARPDGQVTVQQMMLALLRENPQAFGENNINLLRRGAILQMPAADSLNSISPSEALAEVRRQHQLWEDYRGGVASSPDNQPVGAPAPSTGMDAEPAPTGDSRLELVAPDGTAGSTSPGSTASGGADLLREEIDARAQQNAELNGKLLEAEEIIDLLQRQVNIKDDELAALQARLAELGIEDIDITTSEADESGALDDAELADAADVAQTDESMAGEDGDMAAESEGDDELAVAEAELETEIVEPAEEAIEVEEIAVDDAASEPAAAPPLGFPHNLIPEHIAAMVPGGALTVLGAIAALIIGLFAGVIGYLSKSKSADDEATPVAASVAAAADDDSEDLTVAAETEVPDDDSEAVTEIGAVDSSAADFDPNQTVEADAVDTESTAEMEAVVTTEGEDPLEEINVYLAYERFDQAEELVKRVIGEYPDRHEYKARLLEVYYSSNDKTAYEGAARELLDAVGEEDPLWDSAKAMWSAMSPEREMFGAGADVEEAPADDASAFVDITGDAGDVSDNNDGEPGESTVAHAPGGHDDLDFDLAGDGDSQSDDADDILDLTATAAPVGLDNDDDVLDISAADTITDDAVAAEVDDGLDLAETTENDALEIGGDNDILDLTGGDDDVFDLTAGMDDTGADDSLFEATGEGGDLLDVTKTGDIAGVDDTDLLNLTSPGMHADDLAGDAGAGEDNADLEITDITGAAGEAEEALDFDISDTVAPAFDDVAGTADDDVLDLTGGDVDDVLDLTGGGGESGSDDLLDFDIGGLDDGGELDTEGTTITAEADELLDSGNADTIELEPAPEPESDGEIDFDITMDAAQLGAATSVAGDDVADDGGFDLDLGGDFDDSISLQGSDLDGGEDEFDFALDGTNEMDSIAADDTLDMGAVDTSSGTVAEDDASLEDLTLQLDGALDDASLDDLEIEGLGSDSGDAEHLDTIALDGEDTPSIEFEEDQTVVIPVADDVERQSDADEADTKLNLAKAYIELGDNDGARSILNEVSDEGNEAQRAEAESLLGQLPS